MITLANTFEFLQQKSNIQNALDQAQGGALAGVDFDTLVDAGQTGYIWRSAFSDNDRITFEAPIQLPMEHLVIKFDPEQDLHGYENPWPPGGGKNIIPLPSLQGYYAIANGAFGPSDAWVACEKVSVKPNTAYIASTSYLTRWFGICAYDGNGDYIGSLGETSSTTAHTVNLSFTTPENCVSIGVTIAGPTTGSTIRPSDVTDLQIELGSTATPFAPYSNECPITGYTGMTAYQSGEDTDSPSEIAVLWEDEAGTVYGGMWDVITGVLTINYDIVDMGDLTWIKVTDGGKVRFYAIVPGMFVSPDVRSLKLLSSCYKTNIGGTWDDDKTIYNGGNSNRVYVYDSDYTEVSAFETAVTGQTIAYPLATPLTYQLDPVTISTILGVNNIWSDVNTTGIAVTYRDDDPLMLSDPLGVGMMTLK